MAVVTRWSYDHNDYYMGYFGDIYFQNDDVLDTFDFGDSRGLAGVSLKQEIITRIEAYTDDWQLATDIGANLRDLIGTIADMEYVKSAGKTAISRCLTMDGLLPPSGLDLAALQLSAQTILYVLNVTTPGGNMTLGFNYDLSENQFRHIY